MIKVNKNESFPLVVSLLDEGTTSLVSGQTVSYDVRNTNDETVSVLSGSLVESATEVGIYSVLLSLPESGTYIIYIKSYGFVSEAESVMVNEDNLVEIIKSNRSYNTSIIDVARTTTQDQRTSSQISRKVPYGKTDYIITKIKREEDLDWSDPLCTGISYAHYLSEDSTLPFMMGGEF